MLGVPGRVVGVVYLVLDRAGLTDSQRSRRQAGRACDAAQAPGLVDRVSAVICAGAAVACSVNTLVAGGRDVGIVNVRFERPLPWRAFR